MELQRPSSSGYIVAPATHGNGLGRVAGRVGWAAVPSEVRGSQFKISGLSKVTQAFLFRADCGLLMRNLSSRNVTIVEK